MLDVVAEVGDLDAAKAKLRELRGEREKVAGELARTERALPSLADLEPVVRARLSNLRALLAAETGVGRAAFGSLLGEERLALYADGRLEERRGFGPSRRRCGPRRYAPRGEPRGA